jgi:sulfur transfer complex TusBCD TusB component (DsrH family)
MDAAVRVAAVLRLVLHRDVLLALGSGVLVALARTYSNVL